MPWKSRAFSKNNSILTPNGRPKAEQQLRRQKALPSPQSGGGGRLTPVTDLPGNEITAPVICQPPPVRNVTNPAATLAQKTHCCKILFPSSSLQHGERGPKLELIPMGFPGAEGDTLQSYMLQLPGVILRADGSYRPAATHGVDRGAGQ